MNNYRLIVKTKRIPKRYISQNNIDNYLRNFLKELRIII